MQRRNNKYQYKHLIWQDWGIFPGTMLVSVGYKNYEELKKALNKNRCKEWKKALEEKPDTFESHHFSKWKVGDITYQLLFLKDFELDTDYHSILAHELIHAIQFCMPDFLNMEEEYECVAYTHTYLMKEIVKKIMEGRK